MRVIQIATISLTLALTACVSGPGYQNSGMRAQLRDANRIYASGDWSQAADVFERIAAQQQQPEYSKTMLRAADARVLSEDWQLARIDTNRISESLLNQADQAWLQLIRAELALRSGDLDTAESHLLRLDRLPGKLFPRLEILSSRLQLQQAAPESRSLARFRQVIGTIDSSAPGDTARALHLLDSVSGSRLSQMADNAESEQSLGGWLQLALLLRAHLFSSEGLADDIANWKMDNRAHVLNEKAGFRR